MKKKFAVPIILFTLLFMLACGVSLNGISFGDEPEPSDPFKELIAQQTFEAMVAEEPGSAPADATSEPEYQSVIPADSNVERVVAGSHEYSIIASNFDCTCQATDNMTVDIKFTGNQVEITNGGGGATMVYDKISENKYEKTDMGYYILVEGVGDQATETKVEEENHTVISFSTNGYIMESFKGPSSTPCCYYTFTIEK